MASASFSFSNHLIAHKITAYSPQHSQATRIPFRISSSYATAERISSNADQTASFYDVLGIQIGANNQEIKSAYRKLARVLHPDVASNGQDDATSSAADEFMRVHAAYATLSDPEKRAAYDSTIFRRRMRAATLTASGYQEYNRRRNNWETDQCW